ncbi:hypothetical protein WDU94_006992 [Cyamophila willieti]
MKLVHRNINDKDRSGVVVLVPEESEDMWHAYNLIAEGDSVRASTIRKVQNESNTGSSTSSRVRTMLTISVESIDFDTQACVLRLKGRNIQENQYVKLGAYHTLDLELNRKFDLSKSEWDSISLDRIETACNIEKIADVAAVMMQEGLANIMLITASMSLVRTKIEQNIPRKRRGDVKQHEKALVRFYESVMQGILRHINFDVVKCILLASPGFVKDKFFEYMYAEAVKTDNKVLFENKSKFMLVHSSSAFKHSLKEILADPVVMTRMQDTKALGEVKVLDQFYSILSSDPSRAFYGYRHVAAANESQAVETLLIADSLFRNSDLNERKKYVSLVDSVRENGGEVRLFSSMHVSGEQLGQLTGVAAILRFPMGELEDLDEDEDEGEGGG